VIARRKQRPPLLEVTNLLNISTESGDGACDSNRKRQSDGQPDASFEEEEEEGEDDGTSLASLASTKSTLSAVEILSFFSRQFPFFLKTYSLRCSHPNDI